MALLCAPLFGEVGEPHGAVLSNAFGLGLAAGSGLLGAVDLSEPLDGGILAGEAGLLGLFPGDVAIPDLVRVGALRPT
jgi:hypothetical protein